MNCFLNDYALIRENILSQRFKIFADRDDFFEVVKQTGYPFFIWNGIVFKVLDDRIGYEDTGKTMRDIPE